MIGSTHDVSGATARPRRAAALRLISLALLVLAVSTAQPASQAAASQQQPTTTSAAPAATPGAAVASADKGDLPGLTLTIDQFRRSDPNTATVVFTIANKGGEPPVFDWTWGELGLIEVGNAFAFDMSGVYLLDASVIFRRVETRSLDQQRCVADGVLEAVGSRV